MTQRLTTGDVQKTQDKAVNLRAAYLLFSVPACWQSTILSNRDPALYGSRTASRGYFVVIPVGTIDAHCSVKAVAGGLEVLGMASKHRYVGG